MPPHSTTVKPCACRRGERLGEEAFTKESELCQAMNTRIRVSGAGSILQPGRLGIGIRLEGNDVWGFRSIRGSQ